MFTLVQCLVRIRCLGKSHLFMGKVMDMAAGRRLKELGMSFADIRPIRVMFLLSGQGIWSTFPDRKTQSIRGKYVNTSERSKATFLRKKSKEATRVTASPA